ncbi:MAG: hypothetical protein GY862_20350 [Gammaproteobacteria bacterium]|nr:hypothetical protein [Gammaproteobacteria bacterium]
MAETVSASFTCTLGSGAEGAHLSAQVDSRSEDEGGINAQNLGKINGFNPGETISFLVFVSDNIQIETKNIRTTLEKASGAGIPEHGKTSVDMEETVKFTGESRSVSLQKPATSLEEKKWIGNDLETEYGGKMKLSDDKRSLDLPPLPAGMRIGQDDNEDSRAKKRRDASVPGNCLVKYKADALVSEFSTPTEKQMEKFGKPPYDINIIVNGESGSS